MNRVLFFSSFQLVKAMRRAAAVAGMSLLLLLSSCAGGSGAPSSVPSAPSTPSTTQPAAPSPSALFEEFLEREFLAAATSDTFTQHFLMLRPEEFGVADYTAGWGDSLMSYPSDASIAEARARIAEFRAFDRAQLTAEQQDSYDLYAYEAALFEDSLAYWYYGDPFTVSSSHYGYPFEMSEYVFARERDVEDYLALLEGTGDLFAAWTAFEREKADRGLFMNDRQLDGVLEDCEEFLGSGEDNILLTSFERRLGELDGLGEAAAAAYAQRNRTLVEDAVLPAYRELIGALTALRGRGINDGGLAGFDGGRAYYTYRLKAMGLSGTPEDWIAACDEEIDRLYSRQTALLAENPGLADAVKEMLIPEMTPEAIVAFWREETAADFPSLPASVTYVVKPLDDPLYASLGAGLYFTPALDNYESNVIYYNAATFRSSPDSTGLTLAHESFPGHLLQMVGIRMSSLSNYRKTASYAANHEGWAKYVQNYVYKYIGAEPVKELRILEQDVSYAFSFRVDLGIHYEGWSRDDLRAYYLEHRPGADSYSDSTFTYYYNYYTDRPLRLAPYAGGRMEMYALLDRCRAALGDAFSEKDFHEAFLQCGEAPFALIREWLDRDLSGESASAAA